MGFCKVFRKTAATDYYAVSAISKVHFEVDVIDIRQSNEEKKIQRSRLATNFHYGNNNFPKAGKTEM